MTSPYLPVLIAALMPILLAGLAKAGSKQSGVRFDNRLPRETLAQLKGWPQRANWAQQNAWEAFMVFGVAVLIAVQGGVGPARVAFWGWLFIVGRIAYAACYLADLASLRSLCWLCSYAICVGLIVFAL